MSKFEFIAVLLSIVFGLALTNLLSGLLRALFKGELTDTRIAWTLLVGNLVLVNWWVLFRWSDNATWQFYEYVYLVGWALACLWIPSQRLMRIAGWTLASTMLAWSLLVRPVLES